MPRFKDIATLEKELKIISSSKNKSCSDIFELWQSLKDMTTDESGQIHAFGGQTFTEFAKHCGFSDEEIEKWISETFSGTIPR